MREHATTLGLVAAGVVCIGMMQKNVFMDVGGVVSRGEEPGRRLAGDGNEYAQAMRGIGAIFSETSETSVNGIPGAAQMIVTTVLILILGSLAAGAGIGGGGLFVPIYMVLLGAGPKGAVPLSKATILGGAIGNFLSIGPSRHPKAKRPLIDYESSTLMQSGELLGVVFGVLLNGLLPAICIVSFLVLILSYNAYKTINKALKIRAKETKAMNKAKEEDTAKDAQPVKANGEKVEANGEEVEADGMKVEADPVTPPTEAATELDEAAKQDSAEAADVNDIDVNGSDDVKAAISKPSEAPAPAKADVETGEKPVSAELQAILDADSKQYPVWAWALLAPMTAYTVAYKLIANAIRTSDSCSPAGYWLWYVTPIPVLGAFMAYTAYLLSKRHKAKLAAGFEYLTADMQWDTPTLKRFPATALLAGVTAGLLGIGGGMVIGPLFLSIGMEPQAGRPPDSPLPTLRALSTRVAERGNACMRLCAAGGHVVVRVHDPVDRLLGCRHLLCRRPPRPRAHVLVRWLRLHLWADRPAPRQRHTQEDWPAVVRRLPPRVDHRRGVPRDGHHPPHQDDHR